jgi:transcriptional regulator with XRE-family HTH domain
MNRTQEQVRVELGQRLRAVRKDRGRTLEEVSERAGISISALSKIENASLSVTYDTLLMLAAALEIDVTSLFGGNDLARTGSRRVLNRAGKGDIYDAPVYRYEMLCTDLNNKKMIPIVAKIKAHTITQFPTLISHEGEEFIYILEGQVELHTQHYSVALLNKGDSAYYDSTMGHAVVAVGDADATILWTCTNLQGWSPQALSDRPAFAKAVAAADPVAGG